MRAISMGIGVLGMPPAYGRPRPQQGSLHSGTSEIFHDCEVLGVAAVEEDRTPAPGIWIIQSSPALAERAVLLLLIAASLIGIGSGFLISEEQPPLVHSAKQRIEQPQFRLLTSAAKSSQPD